MGEQLTPDDAPRILRCWQPVVDATHVNGFVDRIPMLPSDMRDILACLQVTHAAVVDLRHKVDRLTGLP